MKHTRNNKPLWLATAVLALVVTPALCFSATTDTGVARGAGGGGALNNCLVSLIEEAEVPAQEEGVLYELVVREGSQVTKGQVLGRINDRAAQLKKHMMESAYRAAKEKSENDINVRYSTAAAKVAEAAYDSALEANKRYPNAVGPSEVRRLKLEAERTRLQIEQSQLEQTLLVHDLTSKAAELETADDAVRRRHVISPIEGEVVEMRRHVGEWVSAGQPVLRLVRLDRLRVEGFINASNADPGSLLNRAVLVEVATAGGQRRTVSGRVVYVSPLVHAGGEYRIWAEVDNVKENGRWRIQPGQSARMTIE
jgi:macrolide-specific efflux system membrane fusion protein